MVSIGVHFSSPPNTNPGPMGGPFRAQPMRAQGGPGGAIRAQPMRAQGPTRPPLNNLRQYRAQGGPIGPSSCGPRGAHEAPPK
jgi:hypothetical protein